MIITAQHLGLGKLRDVTWDDSADPFAGSPELVGTPAIGLTLRARQITQPELWADTSETLTVSDYQYMATVLGMKGCFRYLPLAGGGGGISRAELLGALSVKCPDGAGFSMAFVQFARSNGIGEATGAQDGAAATSYLKSLGAPNTVSWAQDLDVSTVANCTAYSNASFDASVAAGWAPAAVGMYAEPGYPLTAEQRYGLRLHWYWATAANDPNKWVAHRGCRVIQLWASSRGEYFPRPGLVLDADVVQSDWFQGYPVVLQAA